MRKFIDSMKEWLLRCLTPGLVQHQKATESDTETKLEMPGETAQCINETQTEPAAETNDPSQADTGKKARKGEEKADDLHTQLYAYLQAHYDLRYNVLTEEAEFREKGSEGDWQHLDKRWQNTLVLRAREAGINSWDVDMGRVMNSHLLPDYHPMLHYMQSLPVWDGLDRLTPLTHRISRDPLWVHGFTTWLLALAAQWEGRMMVTANMLAPILISRQQGRRKSTFCRMLVPDCLQAYYIDRFDPSSQAHAEQRLATTALINMDEFDRYPASVMPSLKNYMQMNASNFRKMRTNRYLNLPRMASFIGTSNRRDLLTDPTGSRRFLCWEVDYDIDCTPILHDQLFAQLHHMLDEGALTYLTPDWERQVEEHNQAYQRISPEQEAFLHCYRLPEAGEKGQRFSATEIFTHLCREYPKVMRGITANGLGRSLTALGIHATHTSRGSAYTLVLL